MVEVGRAMEVLTRVRVASAVEDGVVTCDGPSIPVDVVAVMVLVVAKAVPRAVLVLIARGSVVDDNVGHWGNAGRSQCLVQVDQLLLSAVLGGEVVQLAGHVALRRDGRAGAWRQPHVRNASGLELRDLGLDDAVPISDVARLPTKCLEDDAVRVADVRKRREIRHLALVHDALRSSAGLFRSHLQLARQLAALAARRRREAACGVDCALRHREDGPDGRLDTVRGLGNGVRGWALRDRHTAAIEARSSHAGRLRTRSNDLGSRRVSPSSLQVPPFCWT
mmetsp:Transcript_27047/g.80211  ORF Transcript_27047/g.80211 Transcript_27047/m.80211 type:complete len:279 (+) Transcript_27047:1114-1950(+)